MTMTQLSTVYMGDIPYLVADGLRQWTPPLDSNRRLFNSGLHLRRAGLGLHLRLRAITLTITVTPDYEPGPRADLAHGPADYKA